MNVENQVCSLELAKRLKEIGIKQISIFCWSETKTVPYGTDYRLYYKGLNAEGNFLDYSAFTVAELGNLLPFYDYEIIKSLRFIEFRCEHFQIYFREDNEANARAHMLIYIIESKLMELPS